MYEQGYTPFPKEEKGEKDEVLEALRKRIPKEVKLPRSPPSPKLKGQKENKKVLYTRLCFTHLISNITW